MVSRFNNRFIALFCLLFATLLFLSISYYCLIRAGESLENSGAANNTRTVEVEGVRGSIFDANGISLAYNETSYNVQFTQDAAKTASSDKAKYTDIFMEVIALIEKNGGTTMDAFMIKREDDGSFSWDLSEGLTSSQRAKRIQNYLSNMYIPEEMTSPERIYHLLRERYRIPEQMSYEEAIKLLSIWQEVQLSSYKAYLPVTIAYNVSYTTVVEIEMRAHELMGMSIIESSSRVYPQEETAAHVIGYVGNITSEEAETYQEQGYDIDNDQVGKLGVESTMEAYLTASSNEKKGEMIVELDEDGNIGNVLSSTAASNGYDVYLTLNLELQKVLENALEKNIADVHAKQLQTYQEKKADYDEMLEKTDSKLDLCVAGAAVVMDVNTGKVVSIASMPSYDLNLFVGGISDAEYQQLLDMEGAPLYDYAISSRGTPGSIFKLGMAVAGLMEEKISVNTVINDEGPYDKYIARGRAPACWVKPNYAKHANNQTVVEAIRVSCNYFFLEVADRLGIEKVVEWAGRFGLTEKTGIELTSEAAGRVGNQDILYDNEKSIYAQDSYIPLLVYRRVYSLLEQYGEEREVVYTEEQLAEAAESILQLAGSVEGKIDYGEEIRQIMSDKLDIPTRVSAAKGWALAINQYLNELIWNDTNTVTMGIGTEPTAVTPIAVARYMSAIANGGTVYDATIIEKVVDSEGDIAYEYQPKIHDEIDIPERYLNVIREGMSEVVAYEDGSASSMFEGFTWIDQIAGKTGTGKVSEIDLENNGWFICYACDETGAPQIAVVVYLPNGGSGNNATQTARDFLEYWFEHYNIEETQQPVEGMLVN